MKEITKISILHHFRNSAEKAGTLLLLDWSTGGAGDWGPPGRILVLLLALSAPPSACVCGFLSEDLLKLRFTNTSPGRRQSAPASRGGKMSCPVSLTSSYLQCLYKCRQSLCCLHTIPASCPVKGCAWLSIFPTTPRVCPRSWCLPRPSRQNLWLLSSNDSIILWTININFQ